MNNGPCPLCGFNVSKHVGENFSKCPHCTAVINNKYTPTPYNDNYFTDEYKAQYGKTYEEDYNNIYSISKQRLIKILSLMSISIFNTLSLFEIGSALGFFLKCAQNFGVNELAAIEISEYATDYCSTNLKLHVKNENIENYDFSRKYDIIAAWYVIEHLNDPREILQKCYNALNDRGVLAISVPSTFGPLYYFNRKEWMATHPVDHKVNFNPVAINTLLHNMGFKTVETRPAGIHPERLYKRSYPLYKAFSYLYAKFCNITSFSDTIEVYAVK